MHFLGGKESKIQEHLLKAAYDDGVLLFAASGNSGTDVKEYPASYPCVISVSAVGEDEEYASFSNFNDQVELVGPGVNIKSTTPGNSYGTSMAAPHVAGAAALLWSFFPECSNQQIRNVLASTARDVNPSKTSSGCNIKTGFGLVQAKAAFDVLATFGCDAAGGHDTLPLSDRAEGGCHTLSNTLKTIADIPSTQTPTNTPTLR
jgi:serine protease